MRSRSCPGWPCPGWGNGVLLPRLRSGGMATRSRRSRRAPSSPRMECSFIAAANAPTVHGKSPRRLAVSPTSRSRFPVGTPVHGTRTFLRRPSRFISRAEARRCSRLPRHRGRRGPEAPVVQDQDGLITKKGHEHDNRRYGARPSALPRSRGPRANRGRPGAGESKWWPSRRRRTSSSDDGVVH